MKTSHFRFLKNAQDAMTQDFNYLIDEFGEDYAPALMRWVRKVAKLRTRFKMDGMKCEVIFSLPCWNFDKEFMTAPQKVYLRFNRELVWLEMDLVKFSKHLTTRQNAFLTECPLPINWNDDNQDVHIYREVIYNFAVAIMVYFALWENEAKEQAIYDLFL